MGRWVITGEVERYTLLCGEMGHYWGDGEVHTVVWGDGSLLGRWRGAHCCVGRWSLLGRWRGAHCCVGRWVITGEVERYTMLCGEMGHYWGGGEVHTVVWGDGSLETTPLPQHRMYCITGTRKGLVDMPYRFRISGISMRLFVIMNMTIINCAPTFISPIG